MEPNSLGTSQQEVGGDLGLSLFEDLGPLGEITGTDSEVDAGDLLGTDPSALDGSSNGGPEATWTAEELKILNECLVKYPEGAFTALNRYVKISAHLPGKTIRDIGQKVKAMRSESAALDPKRKLESDTSHSAAKRSREGPADFAHEAAVFAEQEAEVSRALEETERLVQTIRENLVKEETQANAELMSRFSQLIQGVLNRINSMPGVMSALPPLPVKFNTYFLPTQGPLKLPPSASNNT